MSKIKCEVVRDLMPLVADDVASEESKTMVNAHMEECETCRAYYAGMTSALEKAPPQPGDTNFIRFCRKMEKRIRMKRTIIILIIIGILVGGLCGASFYFETRNYRVEIPQENAKAQLFVEEDGDVAFRVEIAEGHSWYGMLGVEMLDGRYYLTPYRPTYPFLKKGYGDGIHEEPAPELVWKDNCLYYRVDEWDMFFNEENGVYEEHRNERLIPVEYVRWGQPNEYTTLYEKGEILPACDELTGPPETPERTETPTNLSPTLQ